MAFDPQARTTWTLKTIGDLLLPEFSVCLSTVWNLLQRMRLPLKRSAQRQRSPDPDYVRKRQRLEASRARAAADPEHHIHLDLDETTVGRRPTLARTYAPKGTRPPRQGSATVEQTRTVFGAVNVVTGACRFRKAPSGAAGHYVAFLEDLLAAHPSHHIAVGIDNWTVHWSTQAKAFYEKCKDRLEIIPLPTYAPFLMPMEKLWNAMRAEVTHNHPFATLQEVCHHFDQWDRRIEREPETVLRRIASFTPG